MIFFANNTKLAQKEDKKYYILKILIKKLFWFNLSFLVYENIDEYILSTVAYPIQFYESSIYFILENLWDFFKQNSHTL